MRKSQELVHNEKRLYEYYSLQKYGMLFSKLNDKEKAVLNFELALKSAKELKNPNAIISSYKLIADYYLKNKIDNEKANYYFYKYYTLNDSLNLENKFLTEKIINNFIKKEKKKTKNKIIDIIKYSFYITFLFFGLFYLLFRVKIHKNSINQNNYVEIIVDDYKFEKMIELLKSNSPEFLILFKELYPKFVENLKKLNPSIKSKELSFCAMIFLNYSSKDIAVFTFVSLRAVQIRKNRLRKKYNISSEVDINRWMRNLNI